MPHQRNREKETTSTIVLDDLDRRSAIEFAQRRCHEGSIEPVDQFTRITVPRSARSDPWIHTVGIFETPTGDQLALIRCDDPRIRSVGLVEMIDTSTFRIIANFTPNSAAALAMILRRHTMRSHDPTTGSASREFLSCYRIGCLLVPLRPPSVVGDTHLVGVIEALDGESVYVVAHSEGRMSIGGSKVAILSAAAADAAAAVLAAFAADFATPAPTRPDAQNPKTSISEDDLSDRRALREMRAVFGLDELA